MPMFRSETDVKMDDASYRISARRTTGIIKVRIFPVPPKHVEVRTDLGSLRSLTVPADE